MNIVSKLKTIRDTLNLVGVDVSHYEAADKTKDYIVWYEDGQGGNLILNNRIEECVVSGTIHFFTKTEYNPIIDKIHDVLNENDDISFELDSVQFETETKLIHYEWRFEI